MNKNQIKVKEATDKVLALFESGEIVEKIKRTVIRKASGQEVPSDNWSLFNFLIMLTNGTEDARGYKQWQQVGRHVKKGAKAFCILGPKMITKENEETGEKEKICVGFVGINVFRYEDTEGAELELPEYRPANLPELSEVAARLGCTVKYAAFRERMSYLGYYQPSSENIVLVTQDAAVFWHELAHAAHYRTGLAQNRNRDEKEVVAEFSAAVISQVFGYDLGNVGHAQEYIKAYAGDPVKAVRQVIGDIEKTLAVIFEESEAASQEAA